MQHDKDCTLTGRYITSLSKRGAGQVELFEMLHKTMRKFMVEAGEQAAVEVYRTVPFCQ